MDLHKSTQKIYQRKEHNETTNESSKSDNFSDFSIDHILNRAGENFVGTNNSSVNPIRPGSYYKENFVKKDIIKHNYVNLNLMFNNEPIFDWLKYTRYHPPKLRRPLQSEYIRKRKSGRLPRVPFTPEQLNDLENSFKLSPYLSSDETYQLAKKLALTDNRIKIWFQNRRAREKREKHERMNNFEILATSYFTEVGLSSHSDQQKENFNNRFSKITQ